MNGVYVIIYNEKYNLFVELRRVKKKAVVPLFWSWFIDLIENPEKFTGYAGPSAHRVWSTIYNENCFGISELSLLSSPNPEKVSLPDTMMDVLDEEGAIPAPSEECLEKRVYYKIISGLHASISTHLCHEFFNQSTGEWVSVAHMAAIRILTLGYRVQICNVSSHASHRILNACSTYTLIRYFFYALSLALVPIYLHMIIVQPEHTRRMRIH